MEGLVLTTMEGPALDARPVEVVERKGKGHPDTICDALVEEVSLTLLRHYDEHVGAPLHHNVDKALLCAGVAEPAFGGGRVVQPMRVFLAGRATMEVEGTRIPVSELAVETARRWLETNLHGLDAARHVEITPLFRPGSAELTELFGRRPERGVALANDTSCGVGFAPFSELERVVLRVERTLTAPETSGADPAVGEDVKVMGIRRGERIDLTVACAFLGRHLRDLDAYAAARERVATIAADAARQVTDRPVRVDVNVADDMERESVYLTVTGTSAEAGDDGQAGRGNRTTGLITPHRPMVMESAPGKNPVSHTGKIYALVAQRIARTLVEEIAEITEARCLLLSRIGAPVDRPVLAEIGLRSRDGYEVDKLRPAVERILRKRMEATRELWRDLVAGRVSALTPDSAP